MADPRFDVRRVLRGRQGRAVAFGVALVAMCAVMALAVIPAVQAEPLAPPLPSPRFAGPGNYCIDDAGSSAQASASGSCDCTPTCDGCPPPCTCPPVECVATDTKVGALIPQIIEPCLAAGDTATVRFSAELIAGSATRYDVAMYVATNGGSAQNGDMCYKDVLQPVAGLHGLGNPMNPLGTGPFKNDDNDSCGEVKAEVGAFYLLQRELKVSCVDANNDGVIDPISTCISWGLTEGQYSCNGVTATMPGPAGAGSNCNCQTLPPEPPILVYRGFDWGDLPDDYGTITESNGPRHAIQDTNHDGIPEDVGGIPGVWLGQIVDYSPSAELDGNPSVDATGDNVANTNDEDGVTVPGRWTEGPNGGQFDVQVSTSSGTCAGCRLGFWIDWNQDGDFGDDSESYLVPVVAGPNAVTFNVPAGAFPVDPLYVRFRLYSPEYIGPIEPNGLAVNGEIEDYVFRFNPNALSMSGFAAAPVATTWPALGGLAAAVALAAAGFTRRKRG